MSSATTAAVILHKSLLLLLLLLRTQQLVAAAAGSFTNHSSMPAVACLPGQASALLRLRRSFSITNASTFTFRSWRAGTDCCRWEGIRCGNADGHVTLLSLDGQRLKSGALDPALFHLTSLEHLNLAFNSFNGSQLPHIGFERLTKLTYLNLSNSDFAGQLPTASISHLTNLVSLDLSTRFEIVDVVGDGYFYSVDSSNSLNLIEPNFETLIANHTNLRELRLDVVDLSDNGMLWCNALASSTPNLRVLSLAFCALSGPICGSLSTMRKLTVINLQFNHLSGPIPDFTTFSALRVLQLRRNKLEGYVSPLLFQHKKLVTIDFYGNNELSGSLPNFSTVSNFEILFVTKTNFSGEIPSSIGNLRSLKNLGLGASQFSGQLPSSIGSLKSLNVLEISGREIVGPIPSWITNLTSLMTLQFDTCGLSGSIPSFVGDLRKLRKLVLCDCNFLGKIPQHISNLTELSILLLYTNNFMGTLKLTSLWRLQHLRYLDISNNNLVVVDGEVNSSLVHFPKLELIGLAGCNITKFPDFLRRQDEVTYLDLSHNDIHGAIPSWAWESWKNNISVLNLANNRFTSVGYSPFLPFQVDLLDLSNNMFKGTIPIPIDTARVLDYSNNNFSMIPSNFTPHLNDVTYFNARGNKFIGEIPTSLCSATRLQFLDLSNNKFSGSIPSCLIENLNGIQVLNLKDNQLDGEFVDIMKEGCSFESLDLSGNGIEGQLPRSLVSCQNLEILDIGNNQIRDSFPCWMSKLRKLQVLVLKSNKLFEQIVQSPMDEESTCAFPSAIIIDLSSNNFSGPLPKDKWFKKLKSMLLRDTSTSLVIDHEVPNSGRTYKDTAAVTYKGHDTPLAPILRTLVFIDLSNNAFCGSIPEAIGELVLLHGLNMSHNSLTGPIPAQLGRLIQMEALDMSCNELSGVIPQELTSLNFLGTLNLSYNKLEGRIPESTQFLTFSNSSFMGNDGLCGPPLSKPCSNKTSLQVTTFKKKNSSTDIMLFLFSGLGFGLGFAVSIVVTWGIPIRKWPPVMQRAL